MVTRMRLTGYDSQSDENVSVAAVTAERSSSVVYTGYVFIPCDVGHKSTYVTVKKNQYSFHVLIYSAFRGTIYYSSGTGNLKFTYGGSVFRTSKKVKNGLVRKKK